MGVWQGQEGPGSAKHTWLPQVRQRDNGMGWDGICTIAFAKEWLLA